MREQIEDYYNGGFLPSDDCGNESQSLGLGNRQLRRPHKLLRSMLEVDGGPVEVSVSGIDDYTHTTNTKIALEAALSDWCRDNYRTLAAQVAGDFLITGRAFAWRLSKRDARFNFGRPLHEADASTDITDDSFFWWAFPYQLKLRDLDAFMEVAKGERGTGGWQKDALKTLKEYIIRKPHGKEEQTFHPALLNEPFPMDRIDEPLLCYAYFEKSEKKDGVYRKVNLRIVTRYSEKCSVSTLEEEDSRTRSLMVTKKLAIKHEDQDKEQVIFAMDGAFDSVLDCLIPWIEDARVSGDQRLDEVEGDGKQFLPRLMAMEGMMDSAVTGTSFAMQPHFSASREVPKRVAQRIQETGLPMFSVAPQGIGLLDKSNVINSSRAGLDIVQALGLSIEEESSSNNLPQAMGKRTNAQFAAEADMMKSANEEGTTLRFIFWHSGWDLLWTAVCKTLIKNGGWSKHDPSFYESKHVREVFEKNGGKLGDLERGTFTFRARRLPGGADRQTAMQRFLLIINNPNAPAEYQQWAFSEIMKLMFGNEAVQHFEKSRARPDQSQIDRAIMQTNAALSSLLPLPAERGDNPIVHLTEVHGPALVSQVQLVSQKGFRDAMDTARVGALVQHMAFDVANIPGTAKEQASQYLEGIVSQFASIPEQAPMDEMQMKQAKLQLETARVQNDLANGQNLRQIRGAQFQQKASGQEFNQMAQAKALGQQDRRIQVEERKAAMSAADLLAPTAQPPIP